MINNQNDTIFLIIDIQEKLLNSVFNKELIQKKAEILLKSAEILNIPTIVTEQYPQGLGKTVFELKENISLYEKKDFNALADENLISELKNTKKNQIVIFGIETHICVYQTVIALLNSGFDVTVVKDACGSRSEYEYNSGLNVMKDSGARIKTTEMLLFELIKSSKHPEFKAIQNLIK